MQKLLHDTWLFFTRSLMLSLRNPIWVFIGLGSVVVWSVAREDF